jgi:glycosyltransferase involved in cell wall biosynthesis
MRPLVSILIPAYNAKRWLADTIKSALNQTWPRKEIIVVDDGSTDDTREIARAFESNSVKILYQSNAGGPAARNKALAHAQGDYIQWLDHDDLLAPNKISAQLREWEEVQDDRVLFSCPFATFYYRTGKARLFQSPLFQDLAPLDYFFLKFSKNTYFQSSCWLVSRKLTDLAGPWWEVRSPDDDGEYFCRIVAVSRGIRFVPEAKCYWRVGNSGSFSRAWQKSSSALESTFESICRSIEHFRSLADNDRSRVACVKFLQDRLFIFYPERPDIVKRMNTLAAALGGALQPPVLKWKYRWIGAIFGWAVAKRAAVACTDFRTAIERTWDQLMYRAGGRCRRNLACEDQGVRK